MRDSIYVVSYVIWDGSSAYVTDQQEMEEIVHDPFAEEEVYGPYFDFSKAASVADEMNAEAGVI